MKTFEWSEKGHIAPLQIVYILDYSAYFFKNKLLGKFGWSLSYTGVL